MTTQANLVTITLGTFRRLYKKYDTYIQGGESPTYGDLEYLMCVASYLMSMPASVLDSETQQRIKILQKYCGEEDRNGDWVLPNPNSMVMLSLWKQIKEVFILEKHNPNEILSKQWDLVNTVFYYSCFAENFPGHSFARPLAQRILKQIEKVLEEQEALVLRLRLNKWAYNMSKTLREEDSLPMEFLDMFID